ncbi:hypothetical protein EST38_g11603 [Candolleomyces aberdarensis]|uniref:Uncharacterized protein n=1 Tax=Candolleomyces aberdarensis TaxID=2316362 RepID=A0A4Q2D6Q8_9AGAR|nr:hypothetical protein EST38_g11603 [Candolleomyces aberdarensis]
MGRTSPIFRLANETLMQIFDHAVHLPAPPNIDFPPTSSVEDKPGIASHATNPTTPVTLSHVCKHWRRLARSISGLWATIFITSDSNGVVKLLTDVWLSNSGSHLLGLTIVGALRSRKRPDFSKILAVLEQESHRWNSFTLDNHWGQWSCLPSSMAPATQLRSLSFNPGCRYEQQVNLQRFVIDSPALREVELRDQDLVMHAAVVSGVISTRLTTLKLRIAMENHPEFFSTLSLFQGLEVLEVKLNKFDGIDRTLQLFQHHFKDEIVYLPALKRFTLIGAQGLAHDRLLMLLDHLEIPSLSDIAIRTAFPAGERAPAVFSALDKMLQRSNAVLQCLSFFDENNDFNLHPFLTHPSLISLEELEARSCQMNILLECLKIESRDTPVDFVLLPKLRHIRLVLYDCSNNPCALSKLAKSRMGVNPLVAKIVSVEAKFSVRRQMEMERRFWDRQPELALVERRFYHGDSIVQ